MRLLTCTLALLHTKYVFGSISEQSEIEAAPHRVKMSNSVVAPHNQIPHYSRVQREVYTMNRGADGGKTSHYVKRVAEDDNGDVHSFRHIHDEFPDGHFNDKESGDSRLDDERSGEIDWSHI